MKPVYVTCCDSCGADGATSIGNFEVGGGRTRKSLMIDSCGSCERKVPIVHWMEIGKTAPRNGARGAGPYLGGPPGIDDPDKVKRHGHRYVYLRDAIEAFGAANEELGASKAALRDAARVLDRLYLLNGNIYVQSLGSVQLGRLLDDTTLTAGDLRVIDHFLLWCQLNRWTSTKDDLLAPYRTAPGWRSDRFDDLVNSACLRCRRAGWVTRMAVGRAEDRVRFALCRRCRRNGTMAELAEIIRRNT